MATAYRSAREHLDDIIRLARQVFLRSAASSGELATIDLELVDLAELIEARMSACTEPLPLERLRDAFQLEPTEQRCLWLAIGFAASSEVRRASGYASGIPIEGFDRTVYASARVRDRFAAELGGNGRLLRYGLLEVDDTPDVPRFARIARVADAILDLAYGVDELGSDVASFASFALPAESPLLVAHELDQALARALRAHVADGSGPIPILRGVDGAGKRSLIAATARALGAKTIVADCRVIPRTARALVALQREAILHRAVLVFAHVEEAGTALALDAHLRFYSGPVAMTASTELTAGPSPARGNLLLEMPVPDEAGRASLWERHGRMSPELAAQAAARYRLSGGQIARAAALVDTSGPDIELAHIHAGVRCVVEDKLAGLATRITWEQSWADLVLPEDSYAELREMIARVRYRRHVIDDWGFGKKVGKGLGLAVLFTGPPGTGKTMAAGLVAKELGLDLYSIDLSRMVSKYIGETEKNLAHLFEAAETGHAILLFDEADSLFSKRTEVKSSVDRYANLEVNYLLQRMEAFSGITILTTNFDAAIDEAFRRRLSFRIAFQLPEEEERARLWQAMLPTVAITRGIDFAELARQFEMSGGYIKNAALRAAYLAAADGEQIGMRHLLHAATSEYAAMGKVMSQRGLGGR
ncbi:MAG: AAA family ATPase [Kofleriaceae bacterium]